MKNGFGRLREIPGAVAACTALALALRFLGLARESIWTDEAMTIGYAGIFGDMTRERLLLNLQGPFHALLLHGWARLFGTGEFALRSIEALAGAASVPLLWWALRPLGRPRAALLAAALLAVSPFHVWYSRELRGYAFLMLLSIVSMGAFLRLPAARARYVVLYTAANVLAFLSNLAAAYLIASQAAATALRGRAGRQLWRTLLLSWTATVLLLSPWLVQFWHRRVEPSGALELRPIAAEERLRGATSAPLLGIPYAYAAFSVGFSYGPSLRDYHGLEREGLGRVLRPHAASMAFAAAAFGLVACLGAVRLCRAGPAARACLMLAVLPVALTFATSLRNVKVFNPRYASAAVPAYALVLAEGILAPRRRAVRIALAASVLVPMAVSLVQAQRDPEYAKEDARSAAACIRTEAQPGDLLFVVGTELPMREYYWHRIGRPADLTVFEDWNWASLPKEEQFRNFEELAARHPRALVLFLRPQDLDPRGEWPAYLERAHPGARRVAWNGASLWILASGGAGPEGAASAERGEGEP